MELRKIDPSILKEDPHNPRQSPVIPALEDQLYANIKAVGLIQPPIFKEPEIKIKRATQSTQVERLDMLRCI